MKTENLAGWVFTFNPHTELWLATTRDNYNQLFNGGKDVLKSKDFHTLQYIIMKTNGNKQKIKQLTNEV